MNKEVKLTYYNTPPSQENTGMKHVLWEITDPDGAVIHDWGFAEWTGKQWADIDVPVGYKSEVAWWANTLEPSYLVSNIIRIGK